MTAKRYHDLDALRAFAMLLGILLHGLLSFIGWPIWPVQDRMQSELYAIPLMFIHGFRMPLFFFVSGFFTMMMWQRRGAGCLLLHRAKRIVLPFFVLGLLIFPILNNMKAFADWVSEERAEGMTQRVETEKALNPDYKVPDDLGGAARKGDLDAIAKFLEGGADIDGKYDQGFTPLHWAAAMGKTEAIELLVGKGAKLNSRDGHQSTPILLAAFFGWSECVRILLEKGADPKLRNKEGSRPLEAMKAGRGITEWVARDILKVPMEWPKVVEGRKEARKILGADPEAAAFFEGDEGSGNWFTRMYMPEGMFITHHLWFLYDLIYLVLAFVLVAYVLKFLPLSGFARWLAESPLRLLLLVPLTALFQAAMGEEFGPSTTVDLEPDFIKLGYYALFFGFGALCFPYQAFHEKVGRFWPIHLMVSALVFFFALGLMDKENQSLAWMEELSWPWLRVTLLSLSSGLFVWLMTFGLIGVFRRFYSRESPKVRFVSDSAYWLYVAHLPLVQVVQLWVSEWPIPSLLKLVIVCVVTTILLLLSYRYLIRYTLVGTMLNGKRT